jgi:hypothetical protein
MVHVISGPLPKHRKQINRELKQLIESEYPDWKTRIYLSTNWIMARYKENPGEYPLLSLVQPVTIRRWLNMYLRQHGRVPQNEKASQLVTWVKA